RVSYTPPECRIELSSVNAAKSALLAGLGIQRLPEAAVADELARGELVHVLADWQIPELGVFAVWPDLGTQKKLTRRFLEFMQAESD
ncbi:MAG: LysR substrate-binding domain-containing protein, partial [Pseudomonadota bacterium]